MSRHVMDHETRRSEGTRVRIYLEMDRRNGLHPAIRALSQRAPTRGDQGRKLREYARIERGREV